MNKNTKIGLVAATVAAVVAVLVGTGQNITIRDDQTLGGYYGIVNVVGVGTPDDYIEVDGSATMKCLVLSGQYIHVTGMNVTGCAGHGVLITGKNIIFENSTVHGTVTENGTGKCNGSGGWGSAVKVQVGGENVVIRGNQVFENCGEGIASTRGVNVTIENNLVYDNFSVNIYVDNTRGAAVRWNDAKCANPNYYRNGQPGGGIGLGAENYSGWGYQLQDVTIENNTMEGCKGIRLYEDSALASGSPKNILIQNNLFVNSFQSVLVNVESAVSVNNVAVSAVQGTVTPSRTPNATVIASATPSRTATKSATPLPATVPATLPPVPSSTPTMVCVPAFSVWVCNGKP